jgi:periplasmic protein TonB
MNRLQKKCVIATAGFHLLLLVILFVGPAFFNSKPKMDDTQLLTMISPNVIDAAFNSGVKGAQPPPPTPIVTPPQPQPTPTPPAPKIVQPTPAPQPTLLTKWETYFKPEPVKPAPAPVENQSHTPKVDLHLVTRNAPKNSTPVKSQNDSRALKNIAAELRHNLSPATTVDAPGESSAAYANYGDVVVSVYHNAWIPPDDMAGDNVTVRIKVTIGRDGTVISAHIVTSSGDASVDAAVQRMLDRVTFIAPFPEGAKETERNYPINFNATRTTE